MRGLAFQGNSIYREGGEIEVSTQPLPGVLYGLTHTEEGVPIIRESRLLKVSIGLPRGKALNVWTVNQDGAIKWKIVRGFKRDAMKTWTFDTRQQTEEFYAKNIGEAPICSYPRKIPFYTFTRPVLGEDGTETFLPDFAAIEAHGPCPTEIDVVFFDDNPFNGAYQFWGSSELKCRGDGINAMRVLTMAPPDVQKQLAGEKYFNVVDACWTRGCQYASKECKPGGDLKFQLANNIRLGGTAYFHTTGFRSISQIFSSLERIKTLTRGRLTGLPLKMTLRPYKVTAPDGKATTQYGVSLELRAEDMDRLRKLLFANLWDGAAQLGAPPKMIEEASTAADEPVISAAAMTAEFYPEATDDAEEQAQSEPPKPEIAKATEAKTDALADKLKAKRAPKQEQVPVEAQGKMEDKSTGPTPTPEKPPVTAPAPAPAQTATTQPGVIPPATYNRDDLF